MSIRLPADAKAKLQALSLATTRPQWRIVTEAIDCYLHLRPAAERGMVGTLLGRPRGRAPRARRAR